MWAKHRLKESGPIGEVAIIGVDPKKNVFRMNGARADGAVLFGKKLSRPQFLRPNGRLAFSRA